MNPKRFLDSGMIGCVLWLGVIFVFLHGVALGQDAAESSASGFEAYRIVYEQNIFDPNRRPQATSRRAEYSERATDLPVTERFSLIGVLVGDEAVVAFFEGSSTVFNAEVKVGGEIAGYRVESIAPTGVLLRRDEEETMLRVGSGMRRSDEEAGWRIDTEVDYDRPIRVGGIGFSETVTDGNDGTATGETSAAEMLERLRALRKQEMDG